MSKKEGRITLKNVRLSFTSAVFVAEKYDDKATHALFSCAFLLDADSKQVTSLERAVKKCLETKFGVGKVPKKALRPENLCYGDYDYGDDDEENDDGDLTLIRSNSRKRPAIIDRDRSPLVEADDKIYAGAICNAVIDLWVQDNKWGKKVNAELKAIQFVEHGERLGGGSSAMSEDDLEDAFEDVSGDYDDEDDLYDDDDALD